MPLPVFSLMLVVFGLTTGEFVISGILPDVASGLSVPVPAAGLLVTAYALGMIIGGPAVTVLTARLARKPLITGLIGTVIGQSAGWRATFGAVAAVTAAALLMVARFVPPQPPAAAGPVTGELRVLANSDVRLAIALTAAGNVGVITVFTYITPLLTHVSGFTARTVPVLLLAYGAGAVAGNFAGGRLADKALMPSLTGLLAALAGVLALFWLTAGIQPLAAILTFITGALAFAIIPGMQARVLATASAAPTLAVAVNASGFQLAAAIAGWLGGQVISHGPGLRSIYLTGTFLTLAGLAIAVCTLRRDRQPAPADRTHESAGKRP